MHFHNSAFDIRLFVLLWAKDSYLLKEIQFGEPECPDWVSTVEIQLDLFINPPPNVTKVRFCKIQLFVDLRKTDLDADLISH